MPFFQSPVAAVPPTTNLSSKTALITGANTGLGYACALQFLQHNLSTAVLAIRSSSKGEAAKQQLLADLVVKANNPNATIVVHRLDLASYDSVLAFADTIRNDFTHLDIALLNAGVSYMSFTSSPFTSNETCLQVNYLSNALIAFLLLPLLLANSSPSPAHLTIVSTDGQKYNSLSKLPLPPSTPIFTHFNTPANYNIFRYSDTKLFASMFVHSLSTHVDPEKVIVNSVCPGMVRTGFDSTLPWYLRGIMWVVKWVRGREKEEGARTLTFASALSDSESHGELLVNNKLAEFTPSSLLPDGEQVQKRLWDETRAEIQRISPGAGKFISP